MTGGVDEQGRTPLLMSSHGKRCESSTIEGCEATSYNTVSKCPGSVGPHALRRRYVTEALNAAQPRGVTADCVDMTTEVLDKHYDHATKEERMERWEDYLVDV